MQFFFADSTITSGIFTSWGSDWAAIEFFIPAYRIGGTLWAI